MSSKPQPPVPPVEFPPARTVTVSGRGEFFLRDSGLISPEHAARPVVMLLHGWTATADLNWFGQYDTLIEAGYRVLAIDHRGHGRGLRSAEKFRLTDCAADAAAVLRKLDLAPAIIVGYSMGGAIAQLIARDHSDVISGMVLSGTGQRFFTDTDKRARRNVKALPLLRLPLSAAPRPTWHFLLSQLGWSDVPGAGWFAGEMLRHNSYAIIEAGAELNRFDSRPWMRRLDVPTAFVLTTRDDVVAPSLQQELIETIKAEIFEAPIRHMQIGDRAHDYNPGLLKALAHVGAKPPVVQVGSRTE